MKKLGLIDSFKLCRFYLLLILGYTILTCICLFNGSNILTINIFFKNVFEPAITAAFFEEFIFRYLIQKWLIEKYSQGVLKKELLMIFIASIIFGFSHFINIFYGESVLYTLFQCISATISGLFFGVFYYKTNRFSYCVSFHFVFDFLLLLGATCEETSGTSISLLSSILSICIMLILSLGTLAMIYSKNGKRMFIDEKKSKALYMCSCIIAVLYFALAFIL